MEEGLIIYGGYSTMRVWEKGKPHIGKPIYENTVHNLIVTVGKNMIGDLLIDEESTGFTYHAIGTGNTAPVVGNTTLNTESERKAFASRIRSGNVITLSWYYTAAECTYNIKESGVYGGASATTSPDSGIMLSHYLQSYDNSGGTYDLTFDYVLTIG